MNPIRFDEFSKALARTTSRQQALILIVGTLTGTVLAGCGNSCNSDSACQSGQSCVNGMCSSSSSSSSSNNSGSGCSGNLTNCNGTCVNINTDFDNCGSCGKGCTGSNAGCCNSSCVDRNTDNNNCGSCGNACSSGSTCMNGSCQAQAQYYIVAIQASGPNILVGTKDFIAQPSCTHADGGVCTGNDLPATVLETLGGPYDSEASATAAYCGMVTNFHVDAFGTKKGTINGKEYNLDNAPACS